MIQPKEIEEYFKDKKIMDDMGWTGEYHLSGKDIVDFFIDRPIDPDSTPKWVKYGEQKTKEYTEPIDLADVVAKKMYENVKEVGDRLGSTPPTREQMFWAYEKVIENLTKMVESLETRIDNLYELTK